jgi:hypothetical protein
MLWLSSAGRAELPRVHGVVVTTEIVRDNKSWLQIPGRASAHAPMSDKLLGTEKRQLVTPEF